MVRRFVQGTRALGILDLDGNAEVEQERHDIGAILPTRGEDSLGRSQVLRMRVHERSHARPVESETGRHKLLFCASLNRNWRRAVANQHIGDTRRAATNRFLVNSRLWRPPAWGASRR